MSQPRILVAGIGTGVGKTVAAAILTTLFQADYWKPIICGEENIEALLDPKYRIFPPAYLLKAPLSPHHAARLEGVIIDSMRPPKTRRPLVIEGVGGVCVPISQQKLTIDLFQTWNCSWVIVSKHYLGSINHTLLTIEALQQRNIPIAGIIFNGVPNPDSEGAILEISKMACLGRIFQEKRIDRSVIRRYARTWA